MELFPSPLASSRLDGGNPFSSVKVLIRLTSSRCRAVIGFIYLVLLLIILSDMEQVIDPKTDHLEFVDQLSAH